MARGAAQAADRRLEDAIIQLIQSQAALTQSQAALTQSQAILGQNQAILTQTVTQLLSRLAGVGGVS